MMKLFMILLGATPPGRHVEQHDFFFGIGESLKDLVPDMEAFWPDAVKGLHIDGWREVTHVDGYRIEIVPKEDTAAQQLFFINLGGYTAGQLAEQHYTLLTVQPAKDKAIQHAKRTAFFKTATVREMKGANSHIDDKYGIDVDDIFNIADILPEHMKTKYSIRISEAEGLPEDAVQLGYFRLHKLPS